MNYQALKGKSKEEVCAVGVIADYYYRKTKHPNQKKYMTVSPYKKLEKDACLLVDRMYNHEPIVVRMMKQEKGMICYSCNNINQNLSRLIIHLNDDHYMNYKQIADHLEDMGYEYYTK